MFGQCKSVSCRIHLLQIVVERASALRCVDRFWSKAFSDGFNRSTGRIINEAFNFSHKSIVLRSLATGSSTGQNRRQALSGDATVAARGDANIAGEDFARVNGAMVEPFSVPALRPLRAALFFMYINTTAPDLILML